jgi:hypothetical protein
MNVSVSISFINQLFLKFSFNSFNASFTSGLAFLPATSNRFCIYSGSVFISQSNSLNCNGASHISAIDFTSIIILAHLSMNDKDFVASKICFRFSNFKFSNSVSFCHRSALISSFILIAFSITSVIISFFAHSLFILEIASDNFEDFSHNHLPVNNLARILFEWAKICSCHSIHLNKNDSYSALYIHDLKVVMTFSLTSTGTLLSINVESLSLIAESTS